MVDKFEVGKWYWYTGGTRGDCWNSGGLMDAVLDGKPRMCTKTDDDTDANFTGVERGERASTWSWGLSMEHWHEVPDPSSNLFMIPKQYLCLFSYSHGIEFGLSGSPRIVKTTEPHAFNWDGVPIMFRIVSKKSAKQKRRSRVLGNLKTE